MKRVISVAMLIIFSVVVARSQESKQQAGISEGVKGDVAKVPDGFGMWTPSDFKEHEKALMSKVGPDHSARETLGDYGNHRIRFIHRVGTGAPEFHTHFVDLWIVESGSGTLVVGGTLVDPKPMGANEPAGDMTGSSVDGGERREVSRGDVIHIPPKTPHQILVRKGEEITYVRIAIPSE